MNATNAIRQNPTQPKPSTIRAQLEGEDFKIAIRNALPKHLSPDRFIRIALTALTRTPKLAQCDQYSFFQCLMSLSAMGLEPDGRRAHLIPFENRKRGVTECQLIVDYKGLVELILRSGTVSFVHADVVCENDLFEYSRGEIKEHKIDFTQPRGRVYAAYAFCRFKDTTEKCDVMGRDEIEAIRQRSRAGKDGPWVTDWNEMAKKTIFRRLSKWLPLSSDFRDAIEADADEASERRFESAKPVAAIFTESAPALPDAEEERAESDSDADLGPTKQARTEPLESDKGPDIFSPQEALAKICVEHGFHFDTFKLWAEQSGNFTPKQVEDVNDFFEVPTEMSNRFLRAKVGLLKGLSSMLTTQKTSNTSNV